MTGTGTLRLGALRTLAAGAAMTLLIAAAPALAVVIDFDNDGTGDGIVKGEVIDTQYAAQIPGGPAGLGASFSATNFTANPNILVAFDSNHYSGGDGDLAAPFPAGVNNTTGEGALSPGNILIIQENFDSCTPSGGPFTNCSDPDDEGSRPAGIINVVFTAPVILETIDFFDIELAEDGKTDDNRISLFGPGGLISDNFFTPHTGNRAWDRVSFDIAGVTEIEIRMGGSGALDNIVFGVPEPGSLTILGIGLAGLGAVRRRRAPQSKREKS